MPDRNQTQIPGGPTTTTTPPNTGTGASNAGTGAGAGTAPPWGSGAQTHTYLGVPNDYTTPQTPTGMWGIPSTFTSGNVPSLYKTGDQYRQLPTDPTQLALLQHAMIDAGLITSGQAKNIAFGSADPATVSAFEKLLVGANISGEKWQDTLSKRLGAVAANPQPAKQVPPLTVELTSPEDIKKTLQDTAKTLLGGYMSDAEANAFVSQFQAQQSQAQTAAYNQQYNAAAGTYGPGGSITAPPTLATAAEDYAKTTEPNKYAGEEFGQKMQVLLNAFTKPVV